MRRDRIGCALYDGSKDDSPEISPAMTDNGNLLAWRLICQGPRECGDAAQRSKQNSQGQCSILKTPFWADMTNVRADPQAPQGLRIQGRRRSWRISRRIPRSRSLRSGISNDRRLMPAKRFLSA